MVNIDRAMRWGFNWDQGPFEAWESMGVKETADRIRAEGKIVIIKVEDNGVKEVRIEKRSETSVSITSGLHKAKIFKKE